MSVPEREVLLGLGSNLGDRDRNLRGALDRLAARGVLRVVAVSSVRTTAPVGGPPQDDYRNAAALVSTALPLHELLAAIKEIERELGRDLDAVRWGPRTVDVDILLAGDETVDDADLVVPHPRLAERRFVLEPAAEIAPDLRHPLLERTVGELLEDLG